MGVARQAADLLYAAQIRASPPPSVPRLVPNLSSVPPKLGRSDAEDGLRGDELETSESSTAGLPDFCEQCDTHYSRARVDNILPLAIRFGGEHFEGELIIEGGL